MTEDRNQSENASDIGVRRESALSVRRGWWLAYAMIFSAQVIAWTILVVLEEIGYGAADRRPSEIAIAVGLKVGTLIVVSVAYTMILLEGVWSIMVISGYLQDKLDEKRRRDAARREAEEAKRGAEEERRIAEEERRIAEAVAVAVSEAVAEAMEVARAETRAEARASRARALAEAHRAWADWNRRRMEADERGEIFHEAPPEFPQETGESK